MKKYIIKSGGKAELKYAKRLTAEYSKSFFFAAQMLPLNIRKAVYSLYGFCRYSDNLVDKQRHRSKEDILEEIRCFSREIEITYRTGSSEHPVLSAFINTAKVFDIPMECPLEFLRGVVMDLEISRYHTFDDLYLFCYRVAGLVGIMMTYVLGYSKPEAFKYAEKLGIAMQLTNILRDVKEDKNIGRIYLPKDELMKFKVHEKHILEEQMNEQVRILIEFQARRAHQYYDEAAPGIPLLSKPTQFSIYTASRIYREILKKIEERGYNPFLDRVFVSKNEKLKILISEYIKYKFAKNRRKLI